MQKQREKHTTKQEAEKAQNEAGKVSNIANVTVMKTSHIGIRNEQDLLLTTINLVHFWDDDKSFQNELGQYNSTALESMKAIFPQFRQCLSIYHCKTKLLFQLSI